MNTTPARGDGAAAQRPTQAASDERVSSIEDLMAYAYAMEVEAAERYAEFADLMEAHNNAEVAELFAKMARIENLHAQQIRDRMHWHVVPAPSAGAYHWDGFEGPETGDHADLHYKMTAHHALQVARVNEQRAWRFYDRLVAQAATEEIREAAIEMRDEEAGHVRLIDDWIARTPPPEDGWEVDLDPPNYNE